MANLFLDTSAQAVRLFYPPEEKADLVKLIDSSIEVFIAEFSRYEFYHTWFSAFGRIFLSASTNPDMGTTITRLGFTHENAKNVQIILGFLIGKQNPISSEPRVLAEQAEMWIEYLMDIYYLEIFGKNEPIKEIDIIGCSMLNEVYSNHNWINELGSFEYPQPERCNRNKAKCTLHKLVKNSEYELKRASSSLEAAKRDSKFRSVVPEVIKDHKVARGALNCSKLSDWMLLKHVPRNCEIATMDEDWVVMAKDYGFTVHKIVVKNIFDRNQAKNKMSGENSA